MIGFIFLIAILSIVECNMDALWDREAFKAGTSNHVYKSLRIISWGFISVLVGLVGAQCGFMQRDFWFIVVICGLAYLIYPLVRKIFFDTILNFYRNKKDDYKTGPIWQKWAAGILLLIDITILFKLL